MHRSQDDAGADVAIAAQISAALRRAAIALESGNGADADSAVAEAADLCRALHKAGKVLPPSSLTEIEDLFGRCGSFLQRLGRELEADSQDESNLRRGIASYRSNQP